MEPEDELGPLAVSGLSPDGFDLSWKPTAHGAFDKLAVEYHDARRPWDVREVQLPGDARGSRIRGLNASTEYEIRVLGVTGSQRSTLLEAVAVTGTSLPLTAPLFDGFSRHVFVHIFLYVCSIPAFIPAYFP
uniref:Fibronectin type-III domain-containing protein n=1 Tax=Salarias fasciatus TaxID=181472 RepID=A0A672HWW0_SALFA